MTRAVRVAGALGLLTGICVGAVAGLDRFAGPLSANIGVALAPIDRPVFWLMDHGVDCCSAFHVGEVLAVKGVFFAGIPLGITSFVLRGRSRALVGPWSDQWTATFYAAFLLQGGSLVLALLLLLGHLIEPSFFVDRPLFAGVIVANVAFGLFALRPWHRLATQPRGRTDMRGR